jgi:hypothetical protein
MSNAYETYLQRVSPGTSVKSGIASNGSVYDSYQARVQQQETAQQQQLKVVQPTPVATPVSTPTVKVQPTPALSVSPGVAKVAKVAGEVVSTALNLPNPLNLRPTAVQAIKAFFTKEAQPAREAFNNLLTEVSTKGLVTPVGTNIPESPQGYQSATGEWTTYEKAKASYPVPEKTTAEKVSQDVGIAMSQLLQGYTGGIVKSNYQPQRLDEKIVGGVANVLGTVTSIKRIAGIFTKLAVGNETVATAIKTYPKIAKIAIPLLQNVVGFDIYGQLDPDQKDRLNSLAKDTLLGTLFTPLGFVKSAVVSVPLSFGLGFGLVKLNKGSDEDAFIMGGILAGLDITGRTSAYLFEKQILGGGNSYVVDPQDAIDATLNSSLKNTLLGKDLLKTSLEARTNGQNVEIYTEKAIKTSEARMLVGANPEQSATITRVRAVDKPVGITGNEIVPTTGAITPVGQAPAEVPTVPVQAGVIGQVTLPDVIQKLPDAPATTYRVDTGFTQAKDTTALDVVNFEEQQNGNDLQISPEVKAELKNVPSSQIVWVTKTATDAKQYGANVQPVDTTGGKVIADIGADGTLILLPPAKPAVEKAKIPATKVNEPKVYVSEQPAEKGWKKVTETSKSGRVYDTYTRRTPTQRFEITNNTVANDGTWKIYNVPVGSGRALGSVGTFKTPQEAMIALNKEIAKGTVTSERPIGGLEKKIQQTESITAKSTQKKVSPTLGGGYRPQAQPTTPLPKTSAEMVKAEADRIKKIEDYINKKNVKFRTKQLTLVPMEKGLVINTVRDVTTKFLNHPDIKGKEYVSPSYLANLAKSVSIPLKDYERQTIQGVVDSMSNNPLVLHDGKIDMEEFAKNVKEELLPLDIIKSDTYASYGAENVGLSGLTPHTYILNSPFEHGRVGHFSGDFNFTIPETELEIKEIPPQPQNPTAKYAVVRKDTPLTPENIEENVFQLAPTKEEAQAWIDSHATPGSAEQTYKNIAVKPRGLFAHFRTFDIEADEAIGQKKIANIAEIQSDVFQAGRDEQIGVAGQRAEVQARIDENKQYLQDAEMRVKNAENQVKEWQNLKTFMKSDAFKKEGLDKNINKYNIAVETRLEKEYGLGGRDLDYLTRFFVDGKFNFKEATNFLDDKIGYVETDRNTYVSDAETYRDRLAKREEELKGMVAVPTKVENQFLSYKDIWHERVIREAINIKASEGFPIIRFPTPRTVAMIEGYIQGENGDENTMPYEITSGDTEGGDLKAGDTIDYGGDEYTVVDAGNYEITVAPTDKVQTFDYEQAKDEDIQAHWDDAKYEFASTEKDWGKIDTAKKAQDVLDKVAIADRYSKFLGKAKRIAVEKERYKNSESNKADRETIKAEKESLANYTAFAKLIKGGIVQKQKLTMDKMESISFKDKLEKKYKIPHAYWNYILDAYRYGYHELTPSQFNKEILGMIENPIENAKNDLERAKASLETAKIQLKDTLNTIRNYEIPSPAEIKSLPKKVLAFVKENAYGYGYSLDYGVENILDEMSLSTQKFTIDDFEQNFIDHENENYEPDYEGIYGTGHVFTQEDGTVYAVDSEAEPETFNQPSEYEQYVPTSIEEFDPTKLSSDQQVVLQFYDKQVNEYLAKYRKDNLELVTDDQGNQWLETKVVPGDFETPTAYRMKDDLAKVGIELTPEQEAEIMKLNAEIFGDAGIKVTSQILANNQALGSYRDQIIKILDKQVNPKDTFYHEAVHKYLDVFMDRASHIELLREAQQVYGLEDLTKVEERLAEDFVTYAKKREGVVGKIRRFFDKIFKTIREYLKNSKRIDNLYDDIISGKAKENAPPEPEKPVKIVKQSEIAKWLSQKLDVPIRRGKFQAGGAIGIFKPKQKVVRIKSGGLSTIFHEVGHFLDNNLKLSDSINTTERKALMSEYGNGNMYANEPKKQRMEAFAEYLRYSLTGQEEKISTLAPEFDATFKKKIADLPEIKEVLDIAREDYARWAEQPATSKILSQLSIGEQPKGTIAQQATYLLHNLYTQALDDLHPLDAFVNLYKKNVGKLEAERDPYILARNLRGWVGKADLFLNKGTFGKTFWKTDANGRTVMNLTGKSYSEIMKPVEKAGVLDDFRVYLIAQRIVNDLAPRGIKTGIALQDAQTALAELDKSHPEFAKIAEERRAYKDSLLDFAQQNGLIGEEALAKIKELNKFHVPFYRVMEESTTQFLGKSKFAGNTPNPIKKIKGSEREIIDPIESDIKDTYAIINASERNNIGVAMANIASENYELGRLFEKVAKPMRPMTVNVEEVLTQALKGSGLSPSDIPEGLSELVVTLFRPMQDHGANMLNVNFGDKSEVFQVDPDLFKAIQGLNAEDVAMIMKIMAIPAKLLRAGATLTPDFSVRNPIRDQFTAFIYSKYGFVPGLDLVRGMFELLKEGDVYDLWKASGAEHSMFVSLDRDVLQRNYKELMRSKGSMALDYIKNPLKTLQLISEFGEAGTRLGEMRRALNAGASPIQAGFSSREVTLDFARIGAKSKAFNMITAFFNANLQGTDKMIREFRTHPFRTLWKILLGITLPSILLYLANRKDPRWKEIPAWQKDLFWIILTPKHIIRIPKPFEPGILFGSVPERILEYMDNKDPYIFNELESDVISGFSPGLLPTGLIPIIENITNYSFFLDRPIVSQGTSNLPPALQANTYTSETAKVIGQALNYSPAKIDNLITGYTGGLGKYAVSALDNILKGTKIVNVPTAPSLALEDMPVIKAFMIRPVSGSNSESVNRIYNLYGIAEPERAYANKLVKNGQEQQASDYVKKHPDILTAKILTSATTQFSDMNTAIKNIRNSRDLSADEKKAKIDAIQNLETDLAERTLQYLKDNPVK